MSYKKKWLSVDEASREFGVTKSSINSLIYSKKIPSKVLDGRRVVPRETLEIRWPVNVTLEDTEAPGNSNENNASQSENESKRIESYWKAVQRETAVKKAQGELVEIGDVRKRVFEGFRILRDSIQQIPDRISPELASEVDPHQVQVMLRREIDTALENFSERLMLGEGASDDGDSTENVDSDQPMDQ